MKAPKLHSSSKYYFGNLAPFGYSTYEVTPDGYIISLKQGLVLRPFIDRFGYCNYSLWRDDGVRFTMRAHQLVAKVYLPNPHNHPQVNHKDGNKLNNHFSNLEWVSNLDNAHHAIEHGLMPHAVLNESQVHQICQMLEQGHTQSNIARRLNLTRSSVSSVKNKRTWMHISEHYDI